MSLFLSSEFPISVFPTLLFSLLVASVLILPIEIDVVLLTGAVAVTVTPVVVVSGF